MLSFQVVLTKLEVENFQGFPFEHFEDEALKFKNKWTKLWEYYGKHIRRQIQRNPDDPEVAKHVQHLRDRRMLCSHEFPGLMQQISKHPPRIPRKPP